ncbi:MAG TPA: hypothetical protein ENN89_00745 [Synergistetes bacterium]|nr:hypothetical protein [Synergistota bacterium]
MNRPGFSLALVILLAASLSFPASSLAISRSDMETIWRNNGAVEGVQEFRFGYVDWIGSSVSVEGKGPIRNNSGPAKILAQKAAVTDGRRNLLLLLYEIRYGLPARLESIDISGKVVEPHIDSEMIIGDEYKISITLPLERLLEECVIFSATVRQGE